MVYIQLSHRRGTLTMQATLIIALVLHVLSGVFWAGTTFALARTAGNDAEQFFRPQMGAATIAVVTGALLWFLLHRGDLGTQGYILALGSFCALLAAGVQGATAAPALRKVSSMGESELWKLRHRVATGQRIAAVFLMITVTCMAAARYA
jgi:hypothetical protein